MALTLSERIAKASAELDEEEKKKKKKQEEKQVQSLPMASSRMTRLVESDKNQNSVIRTQTNIEKSINTSRLNALRRKEERAAQNYWRKK